MRNFKLWIPTTIAILAGACDDIEDAPDRGADEDTIALRPSGTGGGGTGSVLLNTAKADGENTPIRYFHRFGEQVTYDDQNHTRMAFSRLRLKVGNNYVEYNPTTSDIQVTSTGMTINGTALLPGALIGSEWYFVTSSDVSSNPREVMLRVAGAAIAYVPGGQQIPLYDFRRVPGTPDNPWVCKALDAKAVESVVYDGPGGVIPGTSNDFSLPFASVLYQGVRFDGLGTAYADANQIYLACTSGAIGKASLWGYPPWVSSYQGMTGLQQLQPVTRTIRADYCWDGVAHTVDGTPIQIRDRYRAAFDDPTEATESVWGGNGTLCRVTKPRISSNGSFTCSASTNVDCNQLASSWILGSQKFMWTKLDPNTTTYPPKTACNTASGTPGCADPGIEAIVCQQDWYCCAVAWDSICVNEVTQFGASGDACCVDNGGPGCGSASVSQCVGAYDGYCTASRWDSLCALEVEHLGCGRCR